MHPLACETISANSTISELGGENDNAMFIKPIEGNCKLYCI